ncbi:contractile injection system tape measure protein [Aequorivita sp. CIP111184]|uniref:contractile injection system tape measure protein n=1 Tax=Aequorivita sp. CIP111184 TaxID=2211356 RepID=UPI000DBBE1F6|nr:contractile injection system tape measure protein [Aequorivita sp. CIP111184]SRX54969.1 hypothetical protein AEQU1_01989 [Aequorivita sp. CIP111184]
MIAQKNIIKKVKIGVNTSSLENGLQFKDGLDSFFKEEIFPEMDIYFKSLQNNSTKIYRIENISIEISLKENDSMEDLKFLIIKELKNKIKDENISIEELGHVKIISFKQNETEAFFFFLENGHLPWWFEPKPNFWDEFFENFEYQNEVSEKFKRLLLYTETRKRLVFQFNDKQLSKLVSEVLNVKIETFNTNIIKEYRFQFWESILHYSLFKNEKEIEKIFRNIPSKDIARILEISKNIFRLNIPFYAKKVQKKNANHTILFKDEKKQKVVDFNFGEEGILIKNAGFILLHPFLEMFFDKMDFLEEKLIKPGKIDEAIHLLHYLATGKEQAYEHELIFEKFLCNVPIHQPISRNIVLSKERKMACEVLLESVLVHWKALKSNSTQILQNEFLQREGKLTVTNEKQTLYIQRKTQDILLDKLPWNIHLIKIPWKKKILFVEW